MIRKNFDVMQATYGSYGCSVTNRTQFYFSRISVSSYQSCMNVKRYVTLRCFYVTCGNVP